MKKFIEGPNGTLIHDDSYVGEDAWEDDPEPPQENIRQIIESDSSLKPEEKKELTDQLGISGLLLHTYNINILWLIPKCK